MQGMQVWSLVRELRSYIHHVPKTVNIKQKQYCNKFNKDLEVVHIKKILEKQATVVYCVVEELSKQKEVRNKRMTYMIPFNDAQEQAKPNSGV